MAHPLFKKAEQVGEFWFDEISEFYGSGDIVDTADKPRWGKRGKSRKSHGVERTLPRFHEKERSKYAGGKKPTLVLEFTQAIPGESRFTCLIDGFLIVVEKVPLCNKWRAYAENRAWTTPTMIATDPASALLKVCAWPHWFASTMSMSHWGLIGTGGRSVGLYAGVHFRFPARKPKKLPKFYVKTLSTKHCPGNFLARPKP